MQIHPDLTALRSDDAPQRLDQQALHRALEKWQCGPFAGGLDADLEKLAAGAALDGLPLLGALFGADAGAATQFARSLLAALTDAMASAPLGQVPLRHFSDDTIAMLMLARRGSVSLALQVIDGRGIARRPPPASASFAPGETWERVLSGQAEASRLELDAIHPRGAQVRTAPCRLSAGDLLYRDGAREVLQFQAIRGTLVSLKLQRRDTSGEPTREYALPGGELLHQAASTSRDSRLELAATLLGRMGRSDAAPVLAAMAEETGSAALRWEALRECLGLDTGQGFAALTTIARRADDPLAAPAGALRAQLLETYPALAALDQGGAPCRV
jgi:hypothetical protein